MERSKRVLARMTLGALRHLHARGRLMEGVLWQVDAGRLGAGQLGDACSPCCSSGCWWFWVLLSLAAAPLLVAGWPLWDRSSVPARVVRCGLLAACSCGWCATKLVRSPVSFCD